MIEIFVALFLGLAVVITGFVLILTTLRVGVIVLETIKKMFS